MVFGEKVTQNEFFDAFEFVIFCMKLQQHKG